MKRSRFVWLSLLLCLMVVLVSGFADQARCQEKYPTRAIDIIVATGPGGSMDLPARIFAAELKKKWGVPVNVINKPGGSSVPGVMEALNAKPDGYTIMLDNSAVSTQMELSVRDQNIKIPERTRIATVVTTPYIFCVSASSSYKTIKDLEADAKKDPGAFTWPSSGGNSGMDMGARQWFKAIGVDINKTRPVLAQSGGQAITLVTSGAAKMTSVSPTRIIPGVQAGTLRALLVTPKTRLPELPDTPTATEEGYPEVNQQDWTGFSGPANLPADIVDIWCKALEEAIKNPAVLTQIKNIYTYPFYHNSAEFNKIVAQESDGIYKLLGVKK